MLASHPGLAHPHLREVSLWRPRGAPLLLILDGSVTLVLDPLILFFVFDDFEFCEGGLPRCHAVFACQTCYGKDNNTFQFTLLTWFPVAVAIRGDPLGEAEGA